MRGEEVDSTREIPCLRVGTEDKVITALRYYSSVTLSKVVKGVVVEEGLGVIDGLFTNYIKTVVELARQLLSVGRRDKHTHAKQASAGGCVTAITLCAIGTGYGGDV
jgi:hypothetical protein